jgi:hypothetical protein
MISLRHWFIPALGGLVLTSASAAEIGVATIVDGNVRTLRGASWYKLVPGASIEDGDIVEVADRGQVQVELPGGTLVNLARGSSYVVPVPPRASPGGGPTFVIPSGWVKAVVKAPGLRLRTTTSEVAVSTGNIVVHADAPRLEAFVEAGRARLAALNANGSEASVHEGKQDEYWSTSASGAFVPSTRPPKPFIDAMPKHFLDPLPAFAAKFKARVALVRDRDVTYAEAQPWLAGRDRAVFERRFASRLSDPAFRKAVEPDVARYPGWDRRLHPEKYAPPTPVKPAAAR